MPEAYPLLDELPRLDTQALRLWVDEYEDLVVAIADEEAPRPVRPMRAFPLSHRDRYIVLRDEERNEVGVIEDLAALEPDSREAVRDCLERTYVIPQIVKIHTIEIRKQIPTWEVDTDRGPRTIEMRSTRRDLHVMASGQVIVRDADGNQFEVADRRALDPASRTLLETVV